MRLLDDDGFGVNQTVESFCDRLPTPVITAMLASKRVELRKAAVRTLSRNWRALAASDHGTLEPLLQALTDQDAEIRCAAASSLGSAHDPRSADALARALLDDSRKVQCAAALALADRLDPQAEEPLLQLVASLDPTSDRSAWQRGIEALGRIDSVRTRSALQGFLSDESPRTRAAVVGVLARLRSPTERVLLSERCDGDSPWIDPQHPITQERVGLCSAMLAHPIKEVRARYKALAPLFRLRLTWR